MTQQQSQIFMNLWDFPLLTQTTSGVGQMFAAQGFLESAMVISWISQIPIRWTKGKEAEILELPTKTSPRTRKPRPKKPEEPK